MSARDRVRKYRNEGGASDLIRIEVLVAPRDRARVLEFAKSLRDSYREERSAQAGAIQNSIDRALERYGVRVLDNVDLALLRDPFDRAKVVARALMERGDMRAFVMGRKMLQQVEEAR